MQISLTSWEHNMSSARMKLAAKREIEMGGDVREDKHERPEDRRKGKEMLRNK
jgi:hypothetical protein